MGRDEEPAELVGGHWLRARWAVAVLAVVSVAVVLVAGGAGLLERVAGPRTVDRPHVLDGVELPVASESQRFVGVGRAVVPVPEDWGPQGAGCSDTGQGLFVRDLARGTCIVDYARAGWPALGFLDLDSHAGERAAAIADQTGEVDGETVLRGPTCFGGSCAGWSEVVVVPSEGVVVVVPASRSAGPLLAGLRILPEGFVAVPEVGEGWTDGGVGNAILAAGLTYRLSPEPVLPSGRMSVHGTDPAPGTVVPIGSEVVIELDPLVTLDPQSVSIAASITQDYLAQRSPPWDVTEVWARADEGRRAQTGVGRCTSGRLLRISLFGAFPIIVSPIPGGSNTPSEVDLVADPVTREVCEVGARFDVPPDQRTPDLADTQVLDLR